MPQRAETISTRPQSAGTNTLRSPAPPSPSTIAGVSSKRVTIDAAPANIAVLRILTRYPGNLNEQGKHTVGWTYVYHYFLQFRIPLLLIDLPFQHYFVYGGLVLWKNIWISVAVSVVVLAVKRQAIGIPDRHRKGTPHRRWGRLVPVANRRDPRASRRALTSDGAARVGGACLPTGASRSGTQVRCLNRQLSLPVSMISQ